MSTDFGARNDADGPGVVGSGRSLGAGQGSLGDLTPEAAAADDGIEREAGESAGQRAFDDSMGSAGARGDAAGQRAFGDSEGSAGRLGDQAGRRGRRGRRRGRRGDPNAMVPDVEFTSYYGRNIIQPPPWTHDIAAYLFLGGLAAGSGLVAAGAAFTGRPRLRRRSRVAALVALAAGGGALAHDLGRPERVLNMMRTAKLTSPMSVGSWILLGFGGFAGAALATEVASAALPADTVLAKAARLLDPVASAGSAFFAPPLAAYTAVLLSDTAAPTWHEGYRELPALFVSSATAAGAGLALVTSPPAETGPVRALAAIAAASDLVAGEFLNRRLGDLGEPLHEGKPGRLHRLATALTAVGGIGAALAGRNRPVAAASGLALVAGSACTRFAIFDAGIVSAKDPKYTVVPQRARAEAAAKRGEGITQPGGPWPS